MIGRNSKQKLKADKHEAKAKAKQEKADKRTSQKVGKEKGGTKPAPKHKSKKGLASHAPASVETGVELMAAAAPEPGSGSGSVALSPLKMEQADI